jgi:diadenosine tetraphosphate (Ap4A) HIT family hydrolase
VPETPEQLYERVAGSLQTPPVESWEAWPFEGSVRPRRLEPPLEHEPPLVGEGGVDCWRCSAGDDEYIWTGHRWRVRALAPTGLPLVAMLETRDHFAAVADLPTELAAELGVQLARVDRALRALGEIGNVHIGRYGDGSEHLHWWFMVRPARFAQLRTSLITVWDDVLPPIPVEIWQEDVEALRRALNA